MSACGAQVVDEGLREQSPRLLLQLHDRDAAAALLGRRRLVVRHERVLAAGSRRSRAAAGRCRSRESRGRSAARRAASRRGIARRATSASSTVQPITFRSVDRLVVARLQLHLHVHARRRRAAAAARRPGEQTQVGGPARAGACPARRPRRRRRARTASTPSRPRPATITRSPTDGRPSTRGGAPGSRGASPWNRAAASSSAARASARAAPVSPVEIGGPLKARFGEPPLGLGGHVGRLLLQRVDDRVDLAPRVAQPLVEPVLGLAPERLLALAQRVLARLQPSSDSPSDCRSRATRRRSCSSAGGPGRSSRGARRAAPRALPRFCRAWAMTARGRPRRPAISSARLRPGEP